MTDQSVILIERNPVPRCTTHLGEIAYDDHGAGPAVVLLHATLHDRHDYDDCAALLAADHRVLALDWPGHGESTLTPGAALTAAGLARALAEFVTALGLEAVTVVGNSVGGSAAARLALDHPERVAGLVLVDSGGFTRVNLATRTVCAALGRPAVARRVVPRLVPRYMRARSERDRAIAAAAIARARTRSGAAVAASLWASFNDPGYDLRRAARAIAVPTAVVWGRRDPILPVADGRRAVAAIDGAEWHLFDTGHVPFASEPAAVARVIGAVAARAVGGRRG
jgi:pimeloyl-ACP methyl ester carboxylesterase